MRKTVVIISLLAAVTALCCTLPVVEPVNAQGYSGALPNVSAATGTSLRAKYTAGTISVGGSTQSITADGTGLLTTASQSSCAAPAYSSCNIIYWPGSGTALATTTTPTTAFALGNVVVAFVTTSTDDILTIVPAAWNVANTRYLSGSYTTSGSIVLPAQACFGEVSANADTGNATYASLGTSLHPVFQLKTDNTAGAKTHTYHCNITLPTYITAGGGARIVSVDFFYGAQTTNLGTQASVPASGTINGTTVLTYVDYPVASESETSSTEAPVRADSGTAVFTGLGNVTATTAGRFYTLNVAPATPITLETALRQYYLNVTLLCTTTSATVTNTPGLRVNYAIVR